VIDSVCIDFATALVIQVILPFVHPPSGCQNQCCDALVSFYFLRCFAAAVFVAAISVHLSATVAMF
jgi:hypothetical protein